MGHIDGRAYISTYFQIQSDLDYIEIVTHSPEKEKNGIFSVSVNKQKNA